MTTAFYRYEIHTYNPIFLIKSLFGTGQKGLYYSPIHSSESYEVKITQIRLFTRLYSQKLYNGHNKPGSSKRINNHTIFSLKLLCKYCWYIINKQYWFLNSVVYSTLIYMIIILNTYNNGFLGFQSLWKIQTEIMPTIIDIACVYMLQLLEYEWQWIICYIMYDRHIWIHTFKHKIVYTHL